MLKSSSEWQEIVKDYIVIIDPDGWNRRPDKWDDSWNKEEISFEEFMNRAVISTCQYIWQHCNSIDEIFKTLENRIKIMEAQDVDRG
jgi:hypothetical protein